MNLDPAINPLRAGYAEAKIIPACLRCQQVCALARRRGSTNRRQSRAAQERSQRRSLLSRFFILDVYTSLHKTLHAADRNSRTNIPLRATQAFMRPAGRSCARLRTARAGDCAISPHADANSARIALHMPTRARDVAIATTTASAEAGKKIRGARRTVRLNARFAQNCANRKPRVRARVSAKRARARVRIDPDRRRFWFPSRIPAAHRRAPDILRRAQNRQRCFPVRAVRRLRAPAAAT